MRTISPQFELMLQQAIQAFQSGNFDSADLILRRVLQVDSKNLLALNVLGLIKASEAKYREAADFLERAARINPNDASIQFNLAKALTDSGNDKAAIAHHKKAVTLAPKNLDAWLSYGITASNLGRYEDALVCYSNALSLKPDYAEVLFGKGNILYELKRFDEAIAHFDKAINLKPDYPEAWVNKGNILHELKRFDEAITYYDKAISLKSDYYEPWFNKGNTLFQLKRYNEALSTYDRALELKSDNAEIWFNKGNTCYQLNHYEEALRCYENTLCLKSNYPDAWCNKGNVLNKLKHFDEAIAHFDKAISLKPSHLESWFNKGGALREIKLYDEAITHFDKALGLKLDSDWIWGDLLHTKMKICAWTGLSESLESISKKVMANEKVANPFVLLSLKDDPFLHKKSSEIYVQNIYPFSSLLGQIAKPSKNQKIRIGYFSPDFRNHPVSYLTAELYELHDRNKFEIIAFSFGVDDKSLMRLRLGQAFNQFIDVSDMSDSAVAELSRNLRIDIAVDLSGHTNNARTGIFSYRAAPIQTSYIGYLGTMGAEYYDYLLADKTLIPEELQKFYSEKIAYLPSYQVNDRKRIISDREFTREELGLPETGFVFCCFNNNYKILPSTFDVWMRILSVVDGSVLFLYADNEWSKANLIEEAALRGIDSARLIFAEHIPFEDYLARYRVCDLLLDTFPYNAGTTASDALWAELPVLTLVGQSFVSRMAASLLNAIGLPELITNTQEEYEALAIELAINPKKLTDIKLKLANNRLTTLLFDTPLFTRNLETAYIRMYEESQVAF